MCLAFVRQALLFFVPRRRNNPVAALIDRAATMSTSSSSPSSKQLHFDTSTASTAARLPIDPTPASATRATIRQVRGACFAHATPTPLDNVTLVASSPAALRLLGIDEVTNGKDDATLVAGVAGNARLPGSPEPLAHCYAGHQFGSFAGQLGDGRAISLGEVLNDKGERWELQLKGAGLTPFSRHADGRAVLRSSIREFLCSEHMWALGVPTTRAATLVVSETTTVRDPMYNGNPVEEKCAVVLRLAPTFFRFGSWEIFKPASDEDGTAGPSAGIDKLGEQMLDVTIDLHFPEIAKGAGDKIDKYKAFFKEVTVRSARMVAEWQLVGFTHGVMNTDNMSVLGLTIDYGPFGFLDQYDPQFIPNTTDQQGRYRFEAQPQVVKWNLLKFAEALDYAQAMPFALGQEIVQAEYDAAYKEHYLAKLGRKLGVARLTLEGDEELVVALWNTMELTGADFTNTFRSLARLDLGQGSDNKDLVEYLVSMSSTLRELKRASRPRYHRHQLALLAQLKERDLNTFLIITGGDPDFIEVETAKWEAYDKLDKLTAEEKSEGDRAKWATWIAAYKTRVLSELSSSKQSVAEFAAHRRESMNKANPKFVLRNYLAQNAIKAADGGDYSELHRLFKVLTAPFDEHDDVAQYGYDGKRPEAFCDFQLSCSS